MRWMPVFLLLAACGGQAFEPAFQERQEPELANVVHALSSLEPREQSPVMAGVTPDGKLFAYDLGEGRLLWSLPVEVRSVPIIAGRYVVTGEASGVVGRRLADGERAFALTEPDLHLVGADGEGDAVVVSLARGEGENPSGLVAGGRGGLSWSHELPLSVGVPAVAGDLVVVPWAQQRVTVLDLASGAEKLRVRSEHSVVAYALREQHDVYLGQHSLFPFDPNVLAGRGQDGLAPLGRPLPGQPPLLPDGYLPRVDPEGARNRVRLAWSLTEDDGHASFADDAIYFVFYRMVFALPASADDVRWAQDRGHDVVGARAAAGGLFVATDDGRVTLLDAATGATKWETQVGREVQAAELRVAGFTPPEAEHPDAGPPLKEQLEQIASLTDTRLGAGRALAIRFLARDEGADVTAELISLCSDRRDSAAHSAACRAVAERTTGRTHVMAALRENGSYLEEHSPPPVGALAQAAANMHMRNAVPYLIGHLEDPWTPVQELPGLLEGLSGIGDRRAVRPIEAFLRLYHADATGPGMVSAVGTAAAVLLHLDARSAGFVRELSEDPLAPQGARDRLARALTETDEAESSTPQARPEPPPSARPEPEAESSLPEHITSDMKAHILAPIERQLRRCLDRRGEEPLPSARIMIFIDDQAHVQVVSVTPAELQSCVEPLIRSRTFPRTQRGREVLVQVVRR